MSVTETQVLDALKRVKGPDLQGNIVDLGLVSEILIKDGKVYFSITVAPERAEELERHADDPEALRRHVRVCLDVCHGAVMFEPADHLLKWSRRTGWRIGKVQLSSALACRFDERDGFDALNQRWDELQRFEEPRYLHQTVWGHAGRHRRHEFFEDLGEALDDWASISHSDEWRVHFHVPVHLERIGSLGTTQREIVRLLSAIRPEDGIEHFEVETYAWNVLPEEHRPAELADGIAAELNWVRQLDLT